MSRLRPPALVVDTLLALVLTVAALGVVEGGRPATVSSGPALTWSVNPPPRDAGPGAVWNAQLPAGLACAVVHSPDVVLCAVSSGSARPGSARGSARSSGSAITSRSSTAATA